MTDRRMFLGKTGLFLAGGLIGAPAVARASGAREAPDGALGVLVDTTLCIGCRRCEQACDRKNHLTTKPDSYFEDTSVFTQQRPLSPESFTIVNRRIVPHVPKPVFTKTQCMHCNDPACASACIVGALKKTATGAVSYDYDKCIGCRYCMVACPFNAPTYEFSEPLRPRVMKCNFCADLTSAKGGIPACVDSCPVSCLIFGERKELLALGHEWINRSPDRYKKHIYGVHEAGGTSWMYLAATDFHNLGLPDVGNDAPPALSEKIQHSVFKKWIPPLSLYAILGGAMWLFKRRDEAADDSSSATREGADNDDCA